MACDSKTEVKVDDVLIEGVLKVVNQNKYWFGSMTELQTNLTKVLNRKQSEVLPGSPSALRIVLNRVVNRLRSRRVSVRFARTTDHMRKRYVRFAK
jgi:hypothetical protein